MKVRIFKGKTVNRSWLLVGIMLLSGFLFQNSWFTNTQSPNTSNAENQKILDSDHLLATLNQESSVSADSGDKNDGKIAGRNKLSAVQMLSSHEPMTIIGNIGFKAHGNWTGSGSASNPYVFANYTIDVGGSGFGIAIINTTRYFRIENVVVTGASEADKSAILLDNASNGVIKNCTAVNGYFGYYVKTLSSNITFINNNASYNVGTGYFLTGGNKNTTLINNTAYYNAAGYYVGSHFSSGNTLTGNYASFNKGYGYYLPFSSSGSSGNKFIDNKAIGNDGNGFYLFKENNLNSFIQNLAFGNQENGFYCFSNCDSNILINNTATNNIQHGFYFKDGSSLNTFTGNTVRSNNINGFYLSASSNNDFVKNSVTFNLNGFVLESGSNSNTLSENRVGQNTEHGFYLSASSGNDVIDNLVTFNQNGFFLESSSSNTLSENDVGQSTGHGFYLSASSNANLLSENYVDESVGHSFYLSSSSNNNLINNSATASQNGFFLASGSNSNTLTTNLAHLNYNTSYYVFASQSNTLTNNTCNGRKNKFGSTIGIHIEQADQTTLSHNLGCNPKGQEFIMLKNSFSGNLTFEEGTIPSVNWYHPGFNSDFDTYDLYMNGIIIQSGFWTSSRPYISISTVLFYSGGYSFFMNITPSFGSFYTDTISVSITDTSPPAIAGPDDILIFEESQLDRELRWVPTDPYPKSYALYKNSTLLTNSTWTSGVHIVVPIDHLTIGTYEYTIIFSNHFGKIMSDTSLVSIVDTTPPVISNPLNISYEEGQLNNVLEWTALDNYPDTYEIFQNTTLITTDVWVQSIPIYMSVDHLSVGVYNFTVVIRDKFGNWATDTVFIQVYSVSNPTTDSSTEIQSSTSPNGKETTSSPNGKETTSSPNGIETTTTEPVSQTSGFGLMLALFGVLIIVFKRKK